MKTMRASRYPKLLHFPMLILWATPLPVATVWMLLSASMLLLLRHYYVPEGFWSAVMLIAGLLELGMIVPVWILLKTRLKEIEGGEEDAAAQY